MVEYRRKRDRAAVASSGLICRRRWCVRMKKCFAVAGVGMLAVGGSATLTRMTKEGLGDDVPLSNGGRGRKPRGNSDTEDEAGKKNR